MKLIVVTTPTFFVEEDKIITALFEEGLDILHLRKPETPAMYSERLLTLIPEKYHRRIVTHEHFYLKEEFRNWKIIGLYFLLAFLFSLPLFVLAIDWGRWIYIHMMMIIITLSAMLNEESYKEEDPLYTKKNIFIFIFIIFSLIYRVEMSGKGFTFEGFLYRTIMIPGELINKML